MVIEFHTSTQSIGIHAIIRVAKARGMDDPDGGGVVFVIGAAPIRQPFGGGEDLSAHQKRAQAASPSMAEIG
uniref:Uncharacterized protein n=1 Tax=Candidatus Kentrum sp. LPFa TaxID=2126335 RepID=A0A450X4L1_9GAMM|nr:MAG: hypothetical protein BECKLPF1236B_GA0070989_13952 [Candidatus Kentron sp. LPFa]